MNRSALDQIVDTVLYEGYILYPYRPSSKKNQRERFTFGRVYPESYSIAQRGAERCLMKTECLARSRERRATLSVRIRFLQVVRRDVGAFRVPVPRWPAIPEPAFDLVPELRLDDRRIQAWDEAVEREVTLPPIPLRSHGVSFPFAFPSSRAPEPIRRDGAGVAGLIIRRQEQIEGVVVVGVEPAASGLHKISVWIQNQTPVPDWFLSDSGEVLMRTFASTHTILTVNDAEFVSAMDPPAECREAAADCENVGTWPVLVGNEAAGERDTMLSSPIILYDYPRIAPESAGSFFDGTEIDEMLSLRIQTMTGEEQNEMRHAHEYARQLLERTQRMPEREYQNLHGTLRDVRSLDDQVWGGSDRLAGASVGGVFVRAGDRVRVHPKSRADIFDLALKGRTAVVESVEQDAEQRIHFAVVFESDPGKDLGLMRQPGHRFFYGADEVEPLEAAP